MIFHRTKNLNRYLKTAYPVLKKKLIGKRKMSLVREITKTLQTGGRNSCQKIAFLAPVQERTSTSKSLNL
ncbi:unnamed protein product [Callosobruchus maculatus]|uniref:Uncharacterized protein n=1 Tax=Callosobruchus maculatus TaxID=64391 RepID=A0A653D1E1_CALMS|nr:unnamed protein product [Callosobruchus maculatus]